MIGPGQYPTAEACATIKKFCVDFPYTADVHRKAVQQWINKHVADGKGVATVRRYMSEMRGYWSYPRRG